MAKIGTVKWFNSKKGFGFIAPEDGSKDVFVHITAVERAGLDDLREGQKVEFELEADRKSGKQSATNLKEIGSTILARGSPAKIERFCVVTAILGIVGAIAATYLGQAVGWYEPGEGAGFIGAIVGAVLILLVWGFFAGRSASGSGHPTL